MISFPFSKSCLRPGKIVAEAGFAHVCLKGGVDCL